MFKDGRFFFTYLMFYLFFKSVYFSSEKKYSEGWSTDPGRDSQLEFRLSIMHAEKEDSGIYRCETPARQIHQVEIIVEGKSDDYIQVKEKLKYFYNNLVSS